MKKVNRIIVWFRKDLRLHDNEALANAIEQGQEVIPVYVFNPSELSEVMSSIPYTKTGVHRAQFLIQSVAELRKNFQAKGIDLLIRIGKPEEEVFELVKEIDADLVFANMERTHDEVLVQNALEKNLWSIGHEIQFFRGKMLYYTQDLPFPISHAPDSFNTFKKEVERFIAIRPPLPNPNSLNPWSFDVELGEIPQLEDLGYPIKKSSLITSFFEGGETKALKHLDDFVHSSNALDSYQDTYHDLEGKHHSSKLSAWLANGSLSPKKVYAEFSQYPSNKKNSKSLHQFFLELLWRDYCRLMGKKYKDRIFEEGGIIGTESKQLHSNLEVLQQWIDGKTAEPLVNACMLELQKTGYLSQIGRMLTSSYLINDLQINWQLGAAYFQHILIDYDVCSNWVNWNIVGGVGPDNKEDRYINIENQRKKLDPEGTYIKKWLQNNLQGA